MTDANGNRWEYAYTTRNAVAEVRLRDADRTGDSGYSVLTSTAYDFAGRPVQQTDAAGRTTVIDYYHDGLVKATTLKNYHDPSGSTRDLLTAQNSYDAAGNLTRQVTGNGTRTASYLYDAMGRLKSSAEDPSGVARTTNVSYDLAGNVLQVSTTGNSSNLPWPAVIQTQSVSYSYDTASRPTSQRVSLATGSTAITTTRYDQRGYPVAVVDPHGNVTGADPAAFTTSYSYDEVGNPVAVTSPAVSAEQNQQPAVTVRPQVLTGYDAFGDVTSMQDPLGQLSTTGYDRLGRPVRSTAPSYRPPGAGTSITPTRTATYDPAGNLITSVDPRGNTTRYSYNRLGRLISIDAPAASDSDRAVTRYSYLHTGALLSSIGPTGAITQYTYDDLDRTASVTQVERTPQQANLTTLLRYDDADDLTSVTTPSGAVTSAGYDTSGRPISITDPSGVVSRFGYDGAGNRIRSSDGLGRTTKLGYDLGGRLVSAANLDPMLNPLRSISLGYDVAGNATAATDALGQTLTASYDNLNRLVSQAQPVAAGASITTGFGYDVAGNRTRYTDGLGNSTYYLVNSLGLPESVIEPATAAHPALADRTWTTSYDAAGEPVTTVAPGNVQTHSSYDAAGRLTAQTGTGADGPDTARSLGYDLAGRLVSVNTPDATNSYHYDDRGLLVSAAGPSGAADYGYDTDGNLIQRTDVSGTATFGYVKNRLSTQTDPVTGQSQSLTYDGAGAVKAIVYGGLVRSFGYDSLGRQTSDTLTNSASATVTATGYSYDLDDRVIGRTTSGVAGAGSNNYGYDLAGRMTSWTTGGSTTSYAWDAAGNRIQAGTRIASFDQRNRLVSDGGTSYSYTARGTLASQDSAMGIERYTFDAFDRMASDGPQTFGYDGLDRLALQGVTALKYSGLSTDVVADRSQVFGRGPAGSLLSVGQGSTQRSVLTDQHGDVTGGFDPTDSTTSTLPDSRSFDPWGNVTASTGTAYDVGFQGNLTDASTGKVDMNARWYDPSSGTFTSRDSVDNTGQVAAAANRYSYAAGDPVSLIDPTGHGACPSPEPPDLSVLMFSGGLGAGCDPDSPTGDLPRETWPSLPGSAPSSGGGSGSGTGPGSSSGSGGSGTSAAQQLHQQQLAQQRRARQAIANRAKTVQLPAPAAATRPSGQGRVVSSSPHLPARVVSQTANGVRDNKAATQRIYQQAVDQAGDIVQQASPVSSSPSCAGAPAGKGGAEEIPNYHPDPSNPGNIAVPTDAGGGPCGGPGAGGSGSAGSKGGGKPKLKLTFPHLTPSELAQAERDCKQGHKVEACNNYFFQTECYKVHDPSFPLDDDRIGVCLMEHSDPYLPDVHSNPPHRVNLPRILGGSGDNGDANGGGGGSGPPKWLVIAAIAAVAIVVLGAGCAFFFEVCAAVAGEELFEGSVTAILGALARNRGGGSIQKLLKIFIWLDRHGGPIIQRIKDFPPH
jgi:RHS repeat-associated protein